ncbi:DNA-3-methyladenine glycosylase 2 family protein [Mucilaginibacter sp. 14171R-50]|uniref:DNA-3-methyladenine glycosylase family protein n=1 Tax=Mucilaginibacter sp. 14171R-50 TaxID=2703789 RepID=UPI00138CD9F4|nr:DNA-3-methyladenine glycosylase 2 family protein [Mucilaginibacter sp. 14171R-50]QHS54830.1 DNA-3-methyladenine glycosylase 2 family protein [Mucilaginibacter sp. 14171R-50]
MPQQFTQATYHSICDQLAQMDADFANVIKQHSYPPMWTRPNTFETLVHIILEQQVSLASALSALNKLRERVQEITPARVLLLTDAEMRECYCSRQKTAYIKYLAEAIISGEINLEAFEQMEDADIRAKLTALKGIGNWTVDVYLMFVLQHTDVLPIGDLAIVNAIKRLKGLPKETPKDDLVLLAQQWQPYRTVASMLLWHYYLSDRKPSGPPTP